MKKLLMVALLVGGLAAVAKIATAKKAEWQGLTEPEVREKLDTRLPDQMPDEKRAAVADKVVSKMRQRGMLSEPSETTAPAPAEQGDTAADSTDDATGDDNEGETEPA